MNSPLSAAPESRERGGRLEQEDEEVEEIPFVYILRFFSKTVTESQFLLFIFFFSLLSYWLTFEEAIKKRGEGWEVACRPEHY